MSDELIDLLSAFSGRNKGHAESKQRSLKGYGNIYA